MEVTKRERLILGSGGLAALALVILGIFNQPAYSSLIAAAVMWSLASLSMIVLAVTFIHIRRLFDTPAVYLAAAVLFIKAVMVVIPLFVVSADAESFVGVMQIIRSAVDILFLSVSAWVAYCGRPVLGGIVSRLIAAMLTIAAMGIIANFIITWLSLLALTCPVFPLLHWVVILSVLLGTGGLGASFIWLAVRNPRR